MTHTPHPLRIRRVNYRERLPPGAVSVMRPSRWGNPFRMVCTGGVYSVEYQIGRKDAGVVIRDGLTLDEARAEAVEQYRAWLREAPRGREIRKQAREMLRGKKLACCCPLDKPCHADVLAEAVNEGNQ